jgi:hypothetical protein
MMRLVSLCALAGALAACNGDAPGGGGANPAPTPSPAATASSAIIAPPPPSQTPNSTTRVDTVADGARDFSEETREFLFEYSYPRQAGSIEPLAALLDRRLDERLADLSKEAAEARRQAREDGFPYNKHSYSAEWKVVADLPGWLSLSSDIATYSGGAHGNYTIDSLVWDKQRADAIDAKALFTSPAALEEALGERFCEGLDAEREKRRGAPVNPDEEGNSFVDCPGIEELVVLVGSSNRRTFNRLTLYAGPYVAGPYAEGAYEVNLTVDRAIRDAVKPEYRAAFAARN